MKLQCSCGAKYSFEVTPDMANHPVHFSCPTCGIDYSEFVTNLVRQELGSAAGSAIAPPPPGYVAPPPPSGATLSVPIASSPDHSVTVPRQASPAVAPIGSVRVPSIAVPDAIAAAPKPAPAAASAPAAVAPPPGPVAAPAQPTIAIPKPPAAAPAPKPVVRMVSHPAPAPAAPAPIAAAPAAPQPVPAAGLRIHKEAAAAPVAAAAVATATETPANPDAPKPCFRHMGQFAVEKCYVCGKPICPRCMELFGYVCSPLCKSKAEAQGIEVPEFEGQRDVKEARSWRKTVLVSTTVGSVFALLLGVYVWWYAWGSRPHVIFSVRFGEKEHSGESSFIGQDQIVFLHGGTLARHDLKQKKEMWSVNLVDEKEIDAEIAREMDEMKKEIDRANSETPEHVPKMPRPDKLKKELIREAKAELSLRVVGQNIWVMTPKKLTRFDWDTGKTNKEIALKEEWGGLLRHGDELMTLESDHGRESVTRINLSTCDVRSEDIVLPPKPATTKTNANRAIARAAPRPQQKGASGGRGLPTVPGRDAGKPLDPAKVAEQASHLSVPARIALPAVLANTVNQERTLQELDDENGAPAKPVDPNDPERDYFVLIPTKDGFLQFASHLIEAKFVARVAMKSAPQKSALENNPSVANTADIANEMLNDMQRQNGGDKVLDDESRYLVKLQSPGGSNAWSGEIIGSPKLFPLKTVTVLASNKKITVLDKTNKKLWEGTLNYNIIGGYGALDDEEDSPAGEGPCVEHKDTLYVFDQGVITAFDLKTGNARWRVPSVGITGIFFDDKDMVYVNSTDASPETIKYSKQIDISSKVHSLLQKIDPQTGKILWVSHPGGQVAYVSGPYIYSVKSYSGTEQDEEDESPYMPTSGFDAPPYVSIKRINPKNGKEMWEYTEQRAPLDVAFDKNRIRIVFKKEVQVLKFTKL